MILGHVSKSIIRKKFYKAVYQAQMRLIFNQRLLLNIDSVLIICLEASEGIEPPYKDLQSSASPLRHEANRITGEQ